MIQNDHNPNSQLEGSDSNLMEYVYLLWHWAWLILLAGALAGGTAYFVSKSTTPVYETTTRLLVSNPPATSSIDSTSMISSNTMTQTYSQMLTDTPVPPYSVTEEEFKASYRQGAEAPYPFQWTEPLKAECTHFVDCIRTGKTPRSSGEDGLMVVKILETAQISIDNGGVELKIPA